MDDVRLELAVLGPLEVRAEARPVALGDRARTLLLALAVRRGQLVAADTLVDVVWPDDPPAGSRNALQAQVSRLRRALGPAGSRLVTASGGYRLDLRPDEVDADRLADAVTTARSLLADDPAQAAALLAGVLPAWRGDPYVEAADDPEAVAAASRLHELWLEAVELRAEAALAATETAEAPFADAGPAGDGAGAGPPAPGDLVAELAPVAAAHPLRERLQAVLARALYRAGRQSDALEVMARLEHRLRDELGLDPDPDTTALQRAILRHDPELRRRASVDLAAGDGEVRRRPAPPRTSFVGRADELAEVHARLADARLVTLVGPGGTGKTRLALEAARTWSAVPPDGTALVELASLTDADDVLPAVALALGAPVAVPAAPGGGLPAPARPLADRLAAHLADRDLLVVLDNCEHVLDAAAEVAEQLLTVGPGVRVLATSREGLHVAGEMLVPVAPLRTPPAEAADADTDLDALLAVDAVRLFVDRARAASPAFALDADTAPPVVRICRRLDGLPLALELAAARAATVPVGLLAERLSDRFRLLTGGRRTVRRQRTLEAVVEWSYDLLDDRQRAVLRRLGVFAAPPAVEVADRVCSEVDVPRSEVLPTLAELADKSLLELTVEAGDTRVRLLETIREFAQARLAAEDDVAAVRTRHATVLAERAAAAATGLRGADQLTWLDRLDLEHDDLRTALDWLEDTDPDRGVALAADLAWYWWLHEHVPAGRRRLERLLAAAGDERPRAAVAWAWLAFLCSMDRCQSDEVRAAADRAFAGLAAAGDTLSTADQATALLLGGYVQLVDGEGPEAALAAIDRALQAAGDADEPWIESAGHYCKAAAASFAGLPDVALDEAQRALALAEVTGDRWSGFQTRQLLAGLHSRAGQYDDARQDLATAVELADALGAAEPARWLRAQRAVVAMLAGDVPKARGELEIVLASDRGRSAASDGAVRHFLGMVAHRSGEADVAVEHHRAAADLWLTVGEDLGAAEALAGVAFARAAAGDEEGARAAVERAVALVPGSDPGRSRSPRPLGTTLPLLLEAAAAASAGANPGLALRRLGRAGALREAAGAPLVAGERYDVDRIEAAARAALDDAAAEAALDAGRRADGLLPPIA